MKILKALILGCALIGPMQARDSANRITPEMQARLDAEKRTIAAWAANPVIVSATAAQNARGPLPEMTNRAWKRLAPDDALISSFQTNAAGKWLTSKVAAGKGNYREAFLSGAQGELVAFVTKPSSYTHEKEPKFGIPMKGSVWQGKPEFDKSSNSYAIQVAAPVVKGGEPIGVLVVGIAMKSLMQAAR